MIMSNSIDIAINTINTTIEDLRQVVNTKLSKSVSINGKSLSSSPIILSKGDLGLGNVNNTSDARKPISQAQQAALDAKVDKSLTINGYPLTSNVVLPDPIAGRLDQVNNTSDLNKPISTATQLALDNKVNNTITINGYALTSDVALSAEDIGLGQVNNTSDADKPVSNATQSALDIINSSLTSLSTAFNSLANSLQNYVLKTTSVNGHGLSTNVALVKGDIGLGNVDNTSDATKPISTAQQTALNLKVDKTTTVNGYALSSNVSLVKGDVGLGNVDNTSDANKPISTAMHTALNALNLGTSLADVQVTSPSNNQVLSYNSSTSKWTNANVSNQLINVNTSTTLSVNRTYLVDSSSGALTLTMPSSASDGDMLNLYDSRMTWSTNPITLSGATINNIAGSLTVAYPYGLSLVYSSSAGSWQVTTPIFNKYSTIYGPINYYNKIEFLANTGMYNTGTSELNSPVLSTTYMQNKYLFNNLQNIFSIDDVNNVLSISLTNCPTLIYFTALFGFGGAFTSSTATGRVKLTIGSTTTELGSSSTTTAAHGTSVSLQSPQFMCINSATASGYGNTLPMYTGAINTIVSNNETASIYLTTQYSIAFGANKTDNVYFNIIII